MNISGIVKEAKQAIENASSAKELGDIFRAYLGRRGEFASAIGNLKNESVPARKKQGALLNEAKKELANLFAAKQEEFKGEAASEEGWVDVTVPGISTPRGHLHPITRVLWEVEEIFMSLGFSVTAGPEIEDEWHNFDALNIPPNHPARDMWDTFWLKGKKGTLLRTHTSPMQIRYMQEVQPPLRVIVPGKAFRHEATDASHGFQFYQVEGLMVSEDASVANFKALIEEFFQQLFRRPIEIRLRPSYFPFVEPGFEVDMRWGSAWLEMMGAGMVHPNVFKAAGYNPSRWQGIAFGMGLDRIAMMKYGISDLRLFHSGDMRFLEQF